MTEQNNQNNDVFIAKPTEGTAIGSKAYKNRLDLVHVQIADGVTEIGPFNGAETSWKAEGKWFAAPCGF